MISPSQNYRTSSSNYGTISHLPQESDCRVKVRIKPNLKEKNIANRDELYRTLYYKTYTPKSNPQDMYYRPSKFTNMHYMRPMEEKIFRLAPPPIKPVLSEMKSSYKINYSLRKEDRPPELSMIQIKKLDPKPSLPPETRGYCKWLDPYLTASKAAFIPTDLHAAGEDFVTFYNTNYGYKGSNVEIFSRDGNKTMYDKSVFKYVPANRELPKTLKATFSDLRRQSEYQGNYKNQSFSNLYPSLRLNLESFGDSLPTASAWQNLAPPAMYGTDYGHIGSKQGVRSVVDTDLKRKGLFHKVCDSCRTLKEF